MRGLRSKLSLSGAGAGLGASGRLAVKLKVHKFGRPPGAWGSSFAANATSVQASAALLTSVRTKEPMESHCHAVQCQRSITMERPDSTNSARSDRFTVGMHRKRIRGVRKKFFFIGACI